MTRNEFIAKTAAMYCAWNQNAAAVSIPAAVSLADCLEADNVAPWKEPTEQERMMDSLPERMKKIMEELNLGGRAPAVPEPFLGTAVLEVKQPSALKNILADVSKGLPTNAALPPGKWELGFRPVKEDPSGLILPGGIPSAPSN